MGMQATGSSGGGMAGPPGPQNPSGGVNEYSPLSRGFMQNTMGGMFGQKPQQPQGLPPQQQAQPMPTPTGVMPQGMGGGPGGAAQINPFYKQPSGGGMMGGAGKALAGK